MAEDKGCHTEPFSIFASALLDQMDTLDKK
jgi:hypothetical protein